MNGSLIILPMGFEEIEAITTIDILRRANVRLTAVALTYPLQVTGRSRVELLTEGALGECMANQYDLVVLPGGAGYVNYLSSPVLEQFLKSQKGLIAAICAAPVALYRFGMLRGKRYTCHPSVRIVTSTGAGTATPFALKLVELLEGKQKREEIEKDICWRNWQAAGV